MEWLEAVKPQEGAGMDPEGVVSGDLGDVRDTVREEAPAEHPL